MIKMGVPWVASLVLWLNCTSIGAYTTKECLGCHSPGGTATKTISLEQFKHSAHGNDLGCQDCHADIRDESHRTRPGSGAVRCGRCHKQENRHGRSSDGRPLPRCHDCHTRHAILAKTDPKSSVHPDRLTATCKSCHPRESGETDILSRMAAFRVKFHKKQDFGRAFRDTDCLGCHQGKAAHGEERAIVSRTCFKCHQPVRGENPLWGSFHPQADWRTQPALAAAGVADQVGPLLLAVGVLLFIGRKVLTSRRRGR